MAETAAHLVDRVFPPLPVRQWVFSLPKRLRYFLKTNPAAVSAVLHILLDVIRHELIKRCPNAPADARLGAVSFIHRFGDALNGNFIANAQRCYTSEGPLELRAEQRGSACRFGVLDRGPGIPEDQVEAVFRPFHRVDASRSPATGGKGLGLAIVRQLAQANSWQVWLENRREGGLAAWVDVPSPTDQDV